MNRTLCMKLYGGTNIQFSVGGLVGSKSIGIALPHVCFSHFVLHFVCQGLLRNHELFEKFHLSHCTLKNMYYHLHDILLSQSSSILPAALVHTPTTLFASLLSKTDYGLCVSSDLEQHLSLPPADRNFCSKRV
jgi:hypothetical protein